MTRTKSFIKAIAPIGSILLLLVGVLQLRAQNWTLGAICILTAVPVFMFSMRLSEKTPFTVDEIEILRPWIVPVLLWVAIAGLSVVSVMYVSDNFFSVQTNRLAAIAWMGSVLLGLFVTWRGYSWPGAVPSFLQKVRTHRPEFVLLLVVLALAFALRTVSLDSHPYPWSGDEASIGTSAKRILGGETTDFFETGWSSQPNWSFVPTAISEWIFGRNMLAVRLPSVLAGVLAVLFLYLATRELFNPPVALMAVAFLATLPYHVHFSRLGVHNIMDSFLSALMFWLIARAIKTDDARDYYTAGAVGGLCLYTYVGTRLVLILGGIAILFLIVRRRDFFLKHWKHIALFSLAILISVAPEAAYFARHPDNFMGRLAQEGILINGWLGRQAAQTGTSVWGVLLQQFSRTVLVFIASPAVGMFFNSPAPYLTILGSILFLLGMGYALAFALEPRYFLLLVWFWAPVVFGGILTLNPPASTRLLMTTPALAIFMALGTYKVVEYLQGFRSVPARFAVPIYILIVSVISVQHVNFYMVEYQNKGYFQDAGGEYAMEVALMAKAKGRDFQIYVLGAPRVFSDAPTFAFVAPDNPRANLSAEELAALQLPAQGEAGFFAIPENQSLLQQIRQKYPGGQSGLVYRRMYPHELLFEYYIP